MAICRTTPVRATRISARQLAHSPQIDRFDPVWRLQGHLEPISSKISAHGVSLAALERADSKLYVGF